MVDEELLVSLNKVKHLIRHTRNARNATFPNREGLFKIFYLARCSLLRQYRQRKAFKFTILWFLLFFQEFR